MKNYDVVALGELLVDFTQNGISAQGNWLMEANAGGAPCNVLAMLAKLGHSVSFVGKVGDDMFGKMLQSKITSLGIGIENLVFSHTKQRLLLFTLQMTVTEVFRSIEIMARIRCLKNLN